MPAACVGRSTSTNALVQQGMLFLVDHRPHMACRPVEQSSELIKHVKLFGDPSSIGQRCPDVLRASVRSSVLLTPFERRESGQIDIVGWLAELESGKGTNRREAGGGKQTSERNEWFSGLQIGRAHV